MMLPITCGEYNNFLSSLYLLNYILKDTNLDKNLRCDCNMKSAV